MHPLAQPYARPISGSQEHEHTDREGHRGTADHATDGPSPEPALGGVVATDEREPEGIDSVAEQRQPSGQQRDRRGHRDHADDERAESRSEEHTSELQSVMRTSYAVFCLKKK